MAVSVSVSVSVSVPFSGSLSVQGVTRSFDLAPYDEL